MTDKTKTPRELALEALENIKLSLIKYGLNQHSENYDAIKNVLSQEQPEPIEGLEEDIANVISPLSCYNCPSSIIKVARQFHNLTKEKK